MLTLQDLTYEGNDWTRGPFGNYVTETLTPRNKMSHLSDELWLIANNSENFPRKKRRNFAVRWKRPNLVFVNNEKLFSAKFPYLPPPWSEVCERIANLAFSTTVSTNTTLNKIIYEQNLNYEYFFRQRQRTYRKN